MAHCIQALVLHRTHLIIVRERLPSAPCARLTEQYLLLLLSEAVVECLGETSVPAEYAGTFGRLTTGVERFARELSALAPIAYVETEYFGGAGHQSAAAWRLGEVLVKPVSDASSAISTALKAVGIQREGYHDEFEAAGLHRFRNNDDWSASGEPG